MESEGGTVGTDFVVQSELAVAPEGASALEQAFRGRLRAVEHAAGFRRLEVWSDQVCPGRYVMVSWWRSREDFVTYMRSDDHRRSHDRIPGGDFRPRGISVRRFALIAT